MSSRQLEEQRPPGSVQPALEARAVLQLLRREPCPFLHDAHRGRRERILQRALHVLQTVADDADVAAAVEPPRLQVVADRDAGPLPAGPVGGAAAAERRALLRHRRGRARRVQPDRLRLADHADDHRAGRGHRRADRARGRDDRRLLRRLVRHGADADHRHLPVVPVADPVARLRGGARGGARERHRRDRADLLAADRAAGAGRDADAARRGLRLGGEAAGGLERADHLEVDRADVHALGAGAADARRWRR